MAGILKMIFSNIVQMIYIEKKCSILIKILLKFIPKDPFHNKSTDNFK